MTSTILAMSPDVCGAVVGVVPPSVGVRTESLSVGVTETCSGSIVRLNGRPVRVVMDRFSRGPADQLSCEDPTAATKCEGAGSLRSAERRESCLKCIGRSEGRGNVQYRTGWLLIYTVKRMMMKDMNYLIKDAVCIERKMT